MFYIYAFCSIDFDWHYPETVKEFISRTIIDPNYDSEALYLNLSSVMANAICIAKDLEKSIIAATKISGERKFCIEPRIFFIPALNNSFGFNYGFVWKHSDNGTAVIISPIEMPWIDEQYGCFQGILDNDTLFSDGKLFKFYNNMFLTSEEIEKIDK